MGDEFFLYTVLHILRADHLGFKGDDRMTNVPIIDLGNVRRIVCCCPLNLHIFFHENNQTVIVSFVFGQSLRHNPENEGRYGTFSPGYC